MDLDSIIKEAKGTGKKDVVTIAKEMKKDRTKALTDLAIELAKTKFKIMPFGIKLVGHYNKEKDLVIVEVPVTLKMLTATMQGMIKIQMKNWLGLLFEVEVRAEGRKVLIELKSRV